MIEIKEIITDNKDLEYIKECAESVGMDVTDRTAFSISFIAEVMRKMRKHWDGHTEEDVTRLLTLGGNSDEDFDCIYEENGECTCRFYCRHKDIDRNIITGEVKSMKCDKKPKAIESDAISRTELLKHQRSMYDEYLMDWVDVVEVKDIENLPGTSLKTKWISVNKSLPDEDMCVFFYDIFGDIMIGYHPKESENSHFYDSTAQEMVKNVIGWTPFPEFCKIETKPKLDGVKTIDFPKYGGENNE